SHERVFAAMASGSIVATTAKNYPDALTTDGGLVELDVGSTVQETLAALLDDDMSAQETAGKGLAVFRAGHSWTDRARQIWNAVEAGGF
ncbi:MAG: glycosyltransferase family 1 protein, partial [Rhodospirillales bacterium]|nr:glycosyltransferase family 1 protein [Rhodospirillales bacterium]